MIALLLALVAQTSDPRDAEIFGGADEPDTPVEQPQQPVEPSAVPELEGSSEARIGARVAAENDLTAIGGLLYLRLEHAVDEDLDLRNAPLSSPSYMDLYLDARPNDRIRGFARGRVRHDFTVEEGDTDRFGNDVEQSRVLLDQLWLKLDVERVAYLTVGRQAIRWGSGRFWNPTDFLNPVVRDPLAVFDERTGVTLVKVHVPIESLGWNFYAIGNLDGAESPDQAGGALRAELLLGTAELALSGAKRSHGPYQVGVDLTAGVGLVDVRIEAAAQKGVTTPFFRGERIERITQLAPALDATFGSPLFPPPETRSRQDEWIPQVAAGAEIGIRYGDQDNVILGAEYFYNDAGYRSDRMYPALIVNGLFRPLYVGRHYGAAYGLLQAPGDWNDTTIILSVLSNLSDGSYLGRFDYRLQVLTRLSLDVFVNYHFGQSGELRFEADVEGLSASEEQQLDALLALTPPEQRPSAFQERLIRDGFRLKRPLYEVGIGLRTEF